MLTTIRSATARSLLVVISAITLQGCGIGENEAEDGLVFTALAPVPVSDADSSSVPLDLMACSIEAIATDVGRTPASTERCGSDWVYVDWGGLGDSQALLRRVEGAWQIFTAFPSSLCLDEAAAQGVPQSELSSFRPCEAASPTTTSTVERGDLGLSVPQTKPACDGSGIVVLHSATDPAQYVEEISSALAAHPGASYLRTDSSCPSLRQQSVEGNPIYAVYVAGGRTTSELCASVQREGGDAYGKWLDQTSDPTQIVPC